MKVFWIFLGIFFIFILAMSISEEFRNGGNREESEDIIFKENDKKEEAD